MNPFVPVDCEFEIIGYIEEFDDPQTRKMLGFRPIAEPDRPCGSNGRREITITEPLELFKGYMKKPVTIKASKQSPRVVVGMIQIICGRKKEK